MSNIPDILSEFHQISLSQLTAHGITAEQANLIALSVVSIIQQRFKGCSIYIGQDIQTRNKLITAKFNGKNHYALSQEFNLSVKQIYTIVKNAPSKQTALF